MSSKLILRVRWYPLLNVGPNDELEVRNGGVYLNGKLVRFVMVEYQEPQPCPSLN